MLICLVFNSVVCIQFFDCFVVVCVFDFGCLWFTVVLFALLYFLTVLVLFN